MKSNHVSKEWITLVTGSACVCSAIIYDKVLAIKFLLEPAALLGAGDASGTARDLCHTVGAARGALKNGSETPKAAQVPGAMEVPLPCRRKAGAPIATSRYKESKFSSKRQRVTTFLQTKLSCSQ